METLLYIFARTAVAFAQCLPLRCLARLGRCAGGAVRRLEVVFADSTGNSQTSADLPASGAVSAGDTKRYQLWYRDPDLSLCGAGFNLSNGLSVIWEA